MRGDRLIILQRHKAADLRIREQTNSIPSLAGLPRAILRAVI